MQDLSEFMFFSESIWSSSKFSIVPSIAALLAFFIASWNSSATSLASCRKNQPAPAFSTVFKPKRIAGRDLLMKCCFSSSGKMLAIAEVMRSNGDSA